MCKARTDKPISREHRIYIKASSQTRIAVRISALYNNDAALYLPIHCLHEAVFRSAFWLALGNQCAFATMANRTHIFAWSVFFRKL